MQQAHVFYPTLNVIDAMARLIDPIACGINDAVTPLFGHCLKDFEPYAW